MLSHLLRRLQSDAMVLVRHFLIYFYATDAIATGNVVKDGNETFENYYFKLVRFKRILYSTNQNDILIRDSVIEVFVQFIGIHSSTQGRLFGSVTSSVCPTY